MIERKHLAKLITIIFALFLVALVFYFLYLTGIINHKNKQTFYESLPEVTTNQYQPETIEIAYLTTSQTGTATRAVQDGQFILQIYSDIKVPIADDQNFYVWLSAKIDDKDQYIKLGYMEKEDDGYHFNYQTKKNLLSLSRITIAKNYSGDTVPGELVLAGQFR